MLRLVEQEFTSLSIQAVYYGVYTEIKTNQIQTFYTELQSLRQNLQSIFASAHIFHLIFHSKLNLKKPVPHKKYYWSTEMLPKSFFKL